MNKVVLLGTLTVVACALTAAFAQESEKKDKKRSDSVVKIKANLDDKAPAGKAVVVLHLEIEPGWHLYANPPDHEDLGDSQLVVKVVGSNAAKIEYPSGKLVNDKFLGKFKKYDEKIEVRAIVERKAGDNAPIHLTISLQSCSDSAPLICLPPAVVKVTVP